MISFSMSSFLTLVLVTAGVLGVLFPVLALTIVTFLPFSSFTTMLDASSTLSFLVFCSFSEIVFLCINEIKSTEMHLNLLPKVLLQKCQ